MDVDREEEGLVLGELGPDIENCESAMSGCNNEQGHVFNLFYKVSRGVHYRLLDVVPF